MKENWFIPYKYKMVEKISIPPFEKRQQLLKEAGYNLFKIKAKDVYIDLLTDSGTGTMSNEQWAKVILGDESYAGSSSFFEIEKTVNDIMGIPYIIPVHQGRAAERVLNSVIVKEGQIVPGNSHFDTTKAHIELAKGRAIDLTIDESGNSTLIHPFKGNVDINKLENLLNNTPSEKVAYILLTITCNSGGGQPVSMQNIKDVSNLAKKHNIKLFFDAARFAENAYFIKTREEKYKNKSIKEIVLKMFSYVDGFTMSSKKDAIVPIGGLIGIRNKELFESLKVPTILFEGYVTYGGMSGMAMNALAQGLKEVVDFDYLSYRINQVKTLGDLLTEKGIPIVLPTGGHAVFIDGRKFYPNIPINQFPAQYLCCALYECGGIRPIEVGANLADKNPDTGKNIVPKLDLCRLAIPRRSYSYEHIKYIAETVFEVFQGAKNITTGFEFDFESEGIRHFSSTFKTIDKNKTTLL